MSPTHKILGSRFFFFLYTIEKSRCIILRSRCSLILKRCMVKCNFSKAASCTTKACYFVRKKVFAVQAFFFFFDSVTVFTFYEKGGLKTFEPPSSINTLVLILCNCFYSIQASHTT